MLYVFDEIQSLPDDFPEQCIPYLSPERRKKAFSYRFPPDRKLSVTVYLLLRLALKEMYAINEPVAFSYGKNGKPLLRDYPHIHFNLSHCRSAAVCALSPCAIGVDVQETTPVTDDLARRVLTAHEFAAFKNAENPSLTFCEYWVIKESYLKKTGDGVGVYLTDLSSDGIGEATLFKSGNDYCGCVAGACDQTRHVKKSELSF